MDTKIFAGIAKGVLGFGLTGNPSELGKALGNAAVDGAFNRFLTSDPVQKLLDEVTKRLAAAGERGETDRGEFLGNALSEALRRQGYLVKDVLRHGRGDSDAAASTLVGEIDRSFELTDRERSLCRGAVAAFLDKALDDPGAIPGMEAEWHRLVLESLGGILDRLAQLPDDIQRASRSVLLANLVATPGRERFRPDIQSPTALLDPSYRTVDLIGRETISEEILQWCDGPAPITLRLIADEHGAGKTRLCIDLCERLAERGWRVGFVGSIPAGSGMESWLWPQFFSTPAPVFVVMDYANRRTDELKLLLASAVSAAKAGRARIRIVLTSWRAVEWWTQLKEHVDQETHSFLTGPTMVKDGARIPPLSSEARAELYRSAVTSIAARLEKPPPEATGADLDADVFHRPAFIMMAALAAVEGIPPQHWSDALHLLEWVMDRQRRLWTQEVHGDQELGRAVAQAASLVRLRMGCYDHGDVIRLLHAVPLLAGVAAPVLEQVCAALRVHHPGSLYLNPVLPDIVGDYLVSQDIDREPSLGVIALRVGRSADMASGIADTLTVLNTTVQLVPAREPVLEHTLEEYHGDYEVARAAIDVALQSGDPIGRVLSRVLARHPNPQLAARLADAIPWRTVVLRELAAETTSQTLQWLPRGDGVDNTTAISARARVLYNLAYHLSNLGRREEALKASEEAVALHRQLAKDRPDAFLSGLAESLNNQGAMQSALGQRDEALRASEEAVGICRTLAQDHPNAFLPNLGGFLNNLGIRYSELGRRDEALTVSEEAVAVYRRLAQDRPEAFLPNLAMSLNNLARAQSRIGKREQALMVSDETVGVYRRLAKNQPDAFLPNLAMSLSNLGMMQSDGGRREEALSACGEAVVIYRKLALDRPEAFLPGLATSLNNLGRAQSNLGRWEEGLRASEEASAVYRRLAGDEPEAFLPSLAMSVNNLGVQYLALGRRADALRASEEAVGVHRRLSRDQPEAFLSDLAMSLNNLGRALSGLGRREDALRVSEEAVGVYRRLAKDQSDAFVSHLATSLNNLGVIQSDLGRQEEALRASEEAVGIYRRLAEDQAEAFLPNLAMFLSNLGIWYSNLGRREEALRASEEAVVIRRQLAKDQPDAFLPGLALSIAVSGNILRSFDRRDDAISNYLEALRLLLHPFLAMPQAHAAIIGTFVRDYVSLAADLSREPDADLLGPIIAKLKEIGVVRAEGKTGSD